MLGMLKDVNSLLSKLLRVHRDIINKGHNRIKKKKKIRQKCQYKLYLSLLLNLEKRNFTGIYFKRKFKPRKQMFFNLNVNFLMKAHVIVSSSD